MRKYVSLTSVKSVCSDCNIVQFNVDNTFGIFERRYGHQATVSRQLVYGHFVYDTSPTDISSTDISSTMTFLAEIEAGVMKRILYQ